MTPRVPDLATICAADPERVRGLLRALDLSRPELAAVRAAGDDLPRAAAALIDHFRQRRDAGCIIALGLDLCAGDKGDTRIGPEALAAWRAGDFPWHQIAAPQRRADGGIDWQHFGPRGDIEWTFALNRHRFVGQLVAAFARDGDRGHLDCCATWLTDWLAAVPIASEEPSWKPVWRNLECALRVCGNWPLAFFHGLTHGWLDDGAALRLLTFLPEHLRILRHQHGHNPNHLAMEMTGLAVLCGAWPELAAADEARAYARAQMTPQPQRQVYPDGHQKELTAHYHHVALTHLEEYLHVVEALEREPLPAGYRAGIANMWDCIARELDPLGCMPPSNDSEVTSRRADLLDAADRFQRDDWRHVASGGAQGVRPAWGDTAYLPWSGHFIARNGFGPDAHWSWFDCGPHGISGHQHYDKLHLSVCAHGRHLLVDNGRHTHRADAWRQHFIGSYGHNVILCDGRGQDEGVEVVVAPNPNHTCFVELFSFVCSTFDSTYLDTQGEAVHTRAVCYVRDRCWVVIDRFSTDKPRTIQPLWHFHPDCTVAEADGGLVTTDAGVGNLRLVPVADHDWRCDLVRGHDSGDTKNYRMWKADFWPKNADEPITQGWHAPAYNLKLPATCAVYRARIGASTTFAWILVPGRGTPPPVTVLAHTFTEDRAALRFRLGEVEIDLACMLGAASDLTLSDGSVARGVCRVAVR